MTSSVSILYKGMILHLFWVEPSFSWNSVKTNSTSQCGYLRSVIHPMSNLQDFTQKYMNTNSLLACQAFLWARCGPSHTEAEQSVVMRDTDRTLNTSQKERTPGQIIKLTKAKFHQSASGSGSCCWPIVPRPRSKRRNILVLNDNFLLQDAPFYSEESKYLLITIINLTHSLGHKMLQIHCRLMNAFRTRMAQEVGLQ